AFHGQVDQFLLQRIAIIDGLEFVDANVRLGAVESVVLPIIDLLAEDGIAALATVHGIGAVATAQSVFAIAAAQLVFVVAAGELIGAVAVDLDAFDVFDQAGINDLVVDDRLELLGIIRIELDDDGVVGESAIAVAVDGPEGGRQERARLELLANRLRGRREDSSRFFAHLALRDDGNSQCVTMKGTIPREQSY